MFDQGAHIGTDDGEDTLFSQLFSITCCIVIKVRIGDFVKLSRSPSLPFLTGGHGEGLSKPCEREVQRSLVPYLGLLSVVTVN